MLALSECCVPFHARSRLCVYCVRAYHVLSTRSQSCGNIVIIDMIGRIRLDCQPLFDWMIAGNSSKEFAVQSIQHEKTTGDHRNHIRRKYMHTFSQDFRAKTNKSPCSEWTRSNHKQYDVHTFHNTCTIRFTHPREKTHTHTHMYVLSRKLADGVSTAEICKYPNT